MNEFSGDKPLKTHVGLGFGRRKAADKRLNGGCFGHGLSENAKPCPVAIDGLCAK